jgi:hypothetical protein
MFKKGSSGLDMEDKYKGTMGHGTPNKKSVKKFRDMDQNQNQVQSHNTLQRLTGVSMAGGNSNDNEERDSNNFLKDSVTSFFKRTQDFEKELKSKDDIII